MIEVEDLEKIISGELSSIMAGSNLLPYAPVTPEQVSKDSKHKANIRSTKLVDIAREKMIMRIKGEYK